MTDLHEMLDELAAAPAVPSRFDADEVFEAGRRRYRRRRSLTVALAAVLALGVGAGVATAVVSGDLRGATVADDPTPDARRDPRPEEDGRSRVIQWSGAGDAAHLYLVFLACTATGCAKDSFDLVGSDDGGRTWTTRTTGLKAIGWQVVGPNTLLAWTLSDAIVSTDGGRTWSPVAAASTAVPQVPAGGTVLCWPPARDERCALFAVDVAARTMARLPTEPAFDDLTVQDVGGRLWVSGTDRARGTPAVAMSVDRGRTWIPHVLDPCKAQRCAPPELATADGRTVYATLHDGRRWVVHRGTDNADWRRVDGGQLPDGEAPGWSFVAADGTHVVCVPLAEQRPGDTGCRFWALGTDGTYRPATLDGLPVHVGRVDRTPGGWFSTHGYGSQFAVYGSTDGRHWSILTSR